MATDLVHWNSIKLSLKMMMASRLLSKAKAATLTRRLPFSTVASSHDYLQFDTLHSLNANAVKRYEKNPLFGTFFNDKFDWMTYGEFGMRVDKGRGLLSDVGELCNRAVCLFCLA